MVPAINRRKLLISTGAAGVYAFAGCLGDDDDDDTDDVPVDDDDDPIDDDDEPDEGRELMLGVLQPETGDLGDLGTPIADGAVLPAAQLEAAGSPFTVSIQREDSQTESEAGISAAQALVDAGYPMFTGAAASDVTIPVAEQVAIPNEVVMCSPASTAPGITDLDDDDYVYRTAPSDALQGAVMAELVWETFGYESTATLNLNDAYGQALGQVYNDSFEELGGTVTDSVAFEPEQASYTSELETVLGGDPELLMIVAFPVSGVQIFRDFYADFDEDLPILVTDGLIDPDLPVDVDNPMNNVSGTAPAADGPGADAFAELYEDEYDRPPGVFNGHAYDASAVLLLANARAGENVGQSVRDAMREVANPGGEVIDATNLPEGIEMAAAGEEIQYQGATSSVEFDENGDMVAVAYDIFDFQDGEIVQTERVQFEG